VCLRYKAENVLAFLLEWIDISQLRWYRRSCLSFC